MLRPKTEKAYSELCQVIPGGVNSPVRACRQVEQTPLIVSRAEKDKIYDLDGHEYIDFCMSWGALMHGHSHPEILQALQNQMVKGTSYGIATEEEGLLARQVIQLMPHIESLRFVSSGTEATMSAARLARGYIGRDLIVKFDGNYHGHADFFLIKAGSGVMDLNEASSQGIPQDIVRHTRSLPFNDLQAVREIFSDSKKIAAVILEPVAGNMGVVPGADEFIRLLREETSKAGALLIFDEVITGFRVAQGGASALYGVIPDLTCLGKIVGGGLPAAAFGGKREIMDYIAPSGPVYQAGTLSGNPLAMVAGIKALQLLSAPGFYEELERKAHLLLDPISSFIEKNQLNICIQRVGSMFTLFFGKRSVKNWQDAKALDGELFKRFFAHMLAQGIYIPPLQQEAWFLSMAHTDEHLIKTSQAVLQFLAQ